MKQLTLTLILIITFCTSISAQPRGNCSKGGILKCFVSKLPPKLIKIIVVKVPKS